MRFAFIWKRLTYHIFLFKVRGGDCECKIGSWLVKKIYNSQAYVLLLHRYYYKQQCQYEGGKFITALFNLLSWIVKQVSIFIKKKLYHTLPIENWIQCIIKPLYLVYLSDPLYITTYYRGALMSGDPIVSVSWSFPCQSNSIGIIMHQIFIENLN